MRHSKLVILSDLVFVASSLIVVSPLFFRDTFAIRIYTWSHVGCAIFASLCLAELIFASLLTLYRVAHIGTNRLPQCESQHIVLIPHFQEPMDILRRSIQSVIRDGSTRLLIVLGGENTDVEGLGRAETLRDEFASDTVQMVCTVHVPPESSTMRGKHSNLNHMYRNTKTKVEPGAFVTIMDADSVMPMDYFAAVEADAATCANPNCVFWQAPIIVENIASTPASVRHSVNLRTMWQMALISTCYARMTLSTYTLRWSLLEALNGWDPDHIDEDYNLRVRAARICGADVRPIYRAIRSASIVCSTNIGTICATIVQLCRHGIGLHTLHVHMISSMWCESTAIMLRLVTRDIILQIVAPISMLNGLLWLPLFMQESLLGLYCSGGLVFVSILVIITALLINRILLNGTVSWRDFFGTICFPMAVLIFGYLVIASCLVRLTCSGVNHFKYVKAPRARHQPLQLPTEYAVVGVFGVIAFVVLTTASLIVNTPESAALTTVERNLQVILPLTGILLNVFFFFYDNKPPDKAHTQSIADEQSRINGRSLVNLLEQGRGDEHITTILAGYIARKAENKTTTTRCTGQNLENVSNNFVSVND